MTPTVTVVIAAYNHALYVDACMQSVLAQTFRGFEVVVVDDASTDETANKLLAWQTVFTNAGIPFTLIVNTQNLGQYATLEKAIDLATGQYLAVLNSDDAWHPDKLNQQVSFLQTHADIGAVFTHVALIDAQDQPINGHRYEGLFNHPNPPNNRFDWLRQFFLTGNSLCHPSVLIRASVQRQVGRYDCRMGNTADHDYWVRLALQSEWVVLPEPLTQFRLLPGEGNMGGQKPASRLRHAWERTQILSHFTAIPDHQTLTAIFPELVEAGLPQGFTHPAVEIPYWLAIRAFMASSSLHHRFGLNSLHAVMADPEAVSFLSQRYQFGYPQWIQKVGQLNPFNIDLKPPKKPWYKKWFNH